MSVDRTLGMLSFHGVTDPRHVSMYFDHNTLDASQAIFVVDNVQFIIFDVRQAVDYPGTNATHCYGSGNDGDARANAQKFLL
jgi:hypothetical protein